MKSDAQSRLHTSFHVATIGSQFHFVNTIMGAVTPRARTYEKVNEFQALEIHTAKILYIRPDSKIVLLPTSHDVRNETNV